MEKTAIPLTAVIRAYQFIKPYIHQTPLVHSPFLSEYTGADVWLKLENQQPTGSFKVRGALNKIGRLTAGEKAQGIVAASAGNHALGVAHAVQSWGGVQADIFVPETAPLPKINKLRRYPVRLHLAGQTYEDAHQTAVSFAAETGAVEISAYDDLDVITGQATVAWEIFRELPQVDAILLPVGGGGLLAGVTAVAQTIHPAGRIVGVQPEASPAALLSLQAGEAIDPYDHEPTIADGLAGGFGAVPFSLIRDQPPDILLAGETAIRRAVYNLLAEHQLVIEPSGAGAITPLLDGRLDIAGQTVVCVLTGGNLDMTLLPEIVEEMGG